MVQFFIIAIVIIAFYLANLLVSSLDASINLFNLNNIFTHLSRINNQNIKCIGLSNWYKYENEQSIHEKHINEESVHEDSNKSNKLNLDCLECPVADNLNNCQNGQNCQNNFVCKQLQSNLCVSYPACDKLAFSENFANFQDKITNNIWSYYQFIDPVTTLTEIANDGTIIQECDGVIFNSSRFAKSFSHPADQIHFAVTRSVPYSSLNNGVCVEFTTSTTTKNVNEIHNTQFDVFYESNELRPNEDFRLANSAIRILVNNSDNPFVEIAFSKKKIYVVYGVLAPSNSTLRDTFIAAVPILNRKGSLDEKFTFSLCINYDGSIRVFKKDNYTSLHEISPPYGDTCKNKCLLYINNIAVPPTDRKYIILLHSRTGAVGNIPTFISEPTIVNDLTIMVGNMMEMKAMQPSIKTLSRFDSTNTTDTSIDKTVGNVWLPNTVLYNVTGDIPGNIVYRYLCKCGSNDLLTANTVITLPDATSTSTAILNYGQGSIIKMYNMNVCYIN
jgi:hypothetical protein